MKNLKIKIKARTWRRDSYGLFDYESLEINKQELTFQASGRLVRDVNGVRFIKETEEEDPQHEGLFQITVNEQGEYLISKERSIDASACMWIVLSSKISDEKNSHVLREGDVFKMGRIAFKVLQMRISNEEKKCSTTYYKTIYTSIQNHYENQKGRNPMVMIRNEDDLGSLVIGEESSKRICRFCLSESNTIENPLLDVCLCKGSMKYVHFECLQTWLKNKINVDQGVSGIVSLQWKFLSCELCKERLPISFKIMGKSYDLLDFSDNMKKGENSGTNFLILENFSKDGQAIGLQFVDFTLKEQFTFGRGSDCEVKINDISVSRVHGRIKLKNGRMILEDNASKFGTLIQVREPISISETSTHLQAGRTTIEIYNVKSWKSYFSCFNCERPERAVSQLNNNQPLVRRGLLSEDFDETQGQSNK